MYAPRTHLHFLLEIYLVDVRNCYKAMSEQHTVSNHMLRQYTIGGATRSIVLAQGVLDRAPPSRALPPASAPTVQELQTSIAQQQQRSIAYVLMSQEQRKAAAEDSCAARKNGPGIENPSPEEPSRSTGHVLGVATRADPLACDNSLRALLERRLMNVPSALSAEWPNTETQVLTLDGYSERELHFIHIALLMLRERNPTHRLLFALQRDVAERLRPVIHSHDADSL